MFHAHKMLLTWVEMSWREGNLILEGHVLGNFLFWREGGSSDPLKFPMVPCVFLWDTDTPLHVFQYRLSLSYLVTALPDLWHIWFILQLLDYQSHTYNTVDKHSWSVRLLTRHYLEHILVAHVLWLNWYWCQLQWWWKHISNYGTITHQFGTISPAFSVT